MSYILDALRRADAERERDPGRGIHAQSVPLRTEAARRTPWWIAGAATALLLLVGFGLLLRPSPRVSQHLNMPPPNAPRFGHLAPAAPAAPEAPEAPPVTVAAEVSPPAPPPAVAAPAAAVPAPTVLAAAPVPAVAVPGAPRAAAAVPVVAAAAVVPNAAQRPVDRRVGTGAPVTTAGGTAPGEPMIIKAAPAPAAAPAAAAPPAALPAAERVFAVAELPADVQRELPKLQISGGVHSDNAAQRMLIVGGQVVFEGGEAAPGVLVEQIRPKSAVLKFRGWRYSVQY